MDVSGFEAHRQRKKKKEEKKEPKPAALHDVDCWNEDQVRY